RPRRARLTLLPYTTLFRSSLIMLVLMMNFRPAVGFLGTTASDQIVNAHILFNVIILIAGLPLAGIVYRASEKIVALKAKPEAAEDRKSTRLNSSHVKISYA